MFCRLTYFIVAAPSTKDRGRISCRPLDESEKKRQLEIESVYFSGWRSKACLHRAQQK